MSRYLLNTTTATETTTISYTTKASVLRGLTRVAKRQPDAWHAALDADGALLQSIGEVPKPPEPAKRESTMTSVRPFTLELFERGDEVYDIEAQATDFPLRLRVVIVGGSDPGAEGVLGLIEWKRGVNRWVPATAARDESGKLTDFPRPDRAGKPVSGKVKAVAALFDLLGSASVRS